MLSNCYVPNVVKVNSNSNTTSSSIFSSSNDRKDGRTVLQLRSILCNVNVIKDSNGSSLVEYGGSKVICSIHGPRQKAGDTTITSDCGVLECNIRYTSTVAVTKFKVCNSSSSSNSNNNKKTSNNVDIQVVEHNLSKIMKESLASSIRLEMYPKSIITIDVVILGSSDDDSDSTNNDLSAAIIGGSLALADSCIELYDLVSSCTIGQYTSVGNSGKGSGSLIIVDPSVEEVRSCNRYLQLSSLSSLNEISYFNYLNNSNSSGNSTCSSDDDLNNMIEIGVEACKYIRDIMKETLSIKQ